MAELLLPLANWTPPDILDASLKGQQAGTQLGQLLVLGAGKVAENNLQLAEISRQQYQQSRLELYKAMRDPIEDDLKRREIAADLEQAKALNQSRFDINQAEIDARDPVNRAQAGYYGAQTEGQQIQNETDAEYLRIVRGQGASADSPLRTSKYGYPGDSTRDEYSANGIGFIGDNKLTEKAVALTPDVAKRLGAEPGAVIAFRTKDGEVDWGTYEDATDPAIQGRVDLYDPEQTNPLADKELESVWLAKQGDPTIRGAKDAGSRLRALAEANAKEMSQIDVAQKYADTGNALPASEFGGGGDFAGTRALFGQGPSAAPINAAAPPQFTSYENARESLGIAQSQLTGAKGAAKTIDARIKALSAEILQFSKGSTPRASGDKFQRFENNQLAAENRARAAQLRPELDQLLKEKGQLEQNIAAADAIVQHAKAQIDTRFKLAPAKLREDISNSIVVMKSIANVERAAKGARTSAEWPNVPLQGGIEAVRAWLTKYTGLDPAMTDFKSANSDLRLAYQALVKGTPSIIDQEIIDQGMVAPGMSEASAGVVFANMRRGVKVKAVTQLQDVELARADLPQYTKRLVAGGVFTPQEIEDEGLGSREQLQMPTKQETQNNRDADSLAKLKAQLGDPSLRRKVDFPGKNKYAQYDENGKVAIYSSDGKKINAVE